MDESTEKAGSAAPNKTTTILLAVIAVLLVAVAVIIFVNQGSTSPGTPATTNTGGTTGMPPGMGSVTTTATDVPFDPATATKVASGKTPEDHVKAYFDAVVAGDFATAYALLPVSNQAKYGSEAAFTDQLKAYGIQSYTIDGVAEVEGETQVTASASMAGGSFQYVFSFVKEGDTWFAKSRALPGMGN